MAERGDAAEIAALFEELADTGSAAIRNELVERHAGLAAFFARRFRGRGVEDDDLRQVAMVGLVAAVDRFDPGREVQFSTFAGRTINGELKRHFRDRSWTVKVPRRTQELVIETRNAIAELTQRLHRSPTVPEVAEHLDVDEDAVIEAMDAGDAFRPKSLDAPSVGAAGAGTDVATTESSFGEVEDSMVVRELLDTLPERERTIIELRFYHRRSQSEIAAELGISQMHVSRLLRSTLGALRSHLAAEGAGSE